MASSKQTNSDHSESDDDSYCPALPPQLLNRKAEAKVVGPTMPPGMKIPKIDSEDSEDDDLIGPKPPTEPVDENYQIKEFERRAQLMKEKLFKDQEEKSVSRETWMLELPEEKSKLEIFGVSGRSFARKTKEEKGDTSAWTDTPADKERKRQEREQMARQPKQEKRREKNKEEIVSSERDQKLSQYVDEFNKKRRGESLMQMHQKKKKEEPVLEGRRPFSREEDLNVNRFDDAQKSRIIKQSHQLGDRFSSEKQNFL